MAKRVMKIKNAQTNPNMQCFIVAPRILGGGVRTAYVSRIEAGKEMQLTITVKGDLSLQDIADLMKPLSGTYNTVPLVHKIVLKDKP